MSLGNLNSWVLSLSDFESIEISYLLNWCYWLLFSNNLISKRQCRKFGINLALLVLITNDYYQFNTGDQISYFAQVILLSKNSFFNSIIFARISNLKNYHRKKKWKRYDIVDNSIIKHFSQPISTIKKYFSVYWTVVYWNSMFIYCAR